MERGNARPSFSFRFLLPDFFFSVGMTLLSESNPGAVSGIVVFPSLQNMFYFPSCASLNWVYTSPPLNPPALLVYMTICISSLRDPPPPLKLLHKSLSSFLGDVA